MSVQMESYYHSTPKNWRPKVSGLFRKILRSVKNWNDYNSLDRMTDRELDDMGITRGEIARQRRDTVRWFF
jgi:uncharacterized protein YjiS (DUF1127 family)